MNTSEMFEEYEDEVQRLKDALEECRRHYQEAVDWISSEESSE